jgi:hypothetical protein
MPLQLALRFKQRAVGLGPRIFLDSVPCCVNGAKQLSTDRSGGHAKCLLFISADNSRSEREFLYRREN